IGTAPDNTPVQDDDSVTTPVAQTPGLDLIKRSEERRAGKERGAISSSQQATKTGDVTLTSVAITDTGATLGTCTPNQPTTLAPNEALTCSASYGVQPGDVEAGEYSDAATATGSAPDNTPVNDTDAVTTPIAQTPGLDLIK